MTDAELAKLAAMATGMVDIPDPTCDGTIEPVTSLELVEVLDAQEKDDPPPLSWMHSLACEAKHSRASIAALVAEVRRLRAEIHVMRDTAHPAHAAEVAALNRIISGMRERIADLTERTFEDGGR